MKKLANEKDQKKEIKILDKGMGCNSLASQHCCYGASFAFRG